METAGARWTGGLSVSINRVNEAEVPGNILSLRKYKYILTTQQPSPPPHPTLLPHPPYRLL